MDTFNLLKTFANRTIFLFQVLGINGASYPRKFKMRAEIKQMMNLVILLNHLM